MKRLLTLMIGIFCILMFSSNFVNAEVFQFDNVKTYDAVTKEVTITSTFELGGSQDIAKIKLNTPVKNYVPYGIDGRDKKIAEFQLINYENYNNVLEKIDTYNTFDLNTKTERIFTYKVRSYEEVLIKAENETGKDRTEIREVWTPLEKMDFLAGEALTIGIFTNINLGEEVEWIPTFYGKEVNEWATWTTDSQIISGLGDVGGYASPYVFYNQNWILLIEKSTTWGGFSLAPNGTTWISNATTYNGLSASTEGSSTIFNFSNDWYLIQGINNAYKGYNLASNGTTWISNATIISGLYVNEQNLAPEVFYKDSSWYLISGCGGASCGGFYGYVLADNKTTWISNSTITSGLYDIGRYSAPRYFIMNGSSYLLSGEQVNWYGWTLASNGTTWIRNSTIEDGLINNSFEKPAIYRGKGNGLSTDYLYLLVGKEDGTFSGFNLYSPIIPLVTNPRLTLNAPEYYYNTSAPTIIFNVTALDYNINGGISSVILSIDGATDTTNSSGFNGTYIFTKVLSAGLHNWSILANSVNGTSNQSETRFINLTIASPQITLDYPYAYFNTTSTSINFTATITDNLQVQNVSLLIDNILTDTDTSHVNGTYEFIKTLSEGTHYWSILAYDNESNPSQSSNRYFTIDLTNPSINISFPLNNSIIYTDLALVNLTSALINWTASDLHLDKCFLTNISTGTNITGTCNSLNRTFYIPFGTYTYLAYANDTHGNYGSSISINEYKYKLFQISQTYNAIVTETSLQTIAINLSLGSGFSLTSASLIYNGTSYSPSISSSGNYRYLSRDISIPNVSVSTNLSFYWVLNWANSTNSGSVNTSSVNQTIIPITIDNCNVNTITILNYTIYDEDTRSFLTAAVWNTSAKVYARLSGDLSGSVYEFYANTISTNPVRLCINSSFLGGETYRLDAQIQYTAGDYVTEYHYIENSTLNTSVSSKNVSLYLLLINNSQEFLITFKNNNLIPVEGALIEITRQYLNLGSFLSVEISKTDKDGKTIGHFVLNDEVYTLYVKKNGVLLATFENVRAFCSNIVTGDCRINLNQGSTTSNPSSFTNYLGVIGTQSYNDTTKIYTFSFTTTDSTTKTINLSLYSFDNNLTTMICTDQLISSSGTLTCTIPSMYYNGSAVARIYVDNVLYSSSIFYLTINKAAGKGLNPGRYILAFLLIITIPLLAFTSGPMTLIMFIVGLIIAGGLALIDYGGFIGPFSAFLWFIIAAIVLLVKASRRREQ